MEKEYKPKHVEEKWRDFWEPFQTPSSGDKTYTIILPPPNVTGVLHMGHAFVNTLQDILIRKKRMEGYKALFVPGTDHAGIATQSVVERTLYEKTGKRKEDFTREEFLKEIWKFKEEKEGTILSQLRMIGSSLDWSRRRFTMDKESSKAVFTCFKKLFDEDLIYRGNYLVNWDPVLQTAISDDEVEYEEIASSLWYFRYPIQDSEEYLTIATTRPETLLGDVAIAVHPEDARFRSLVGKSCLLPIINRPIPIIQDDYVSPEFGSGCVKITPAHDLNDYEMALRHDLPMINIMTPDGKILPEISPFANLSMKEARKAIVEEMKRLNLLEKIEPHTLRVGTSYRSKAVIEPYLSKQWFMRMKPFKKMLLDVVKNNEVQIFPEKSKQTYFHWIENIRDWCISRQLVWGHHIPVWHSINNPDTYLCSDGETPPKEVQENPDEWIRDKDVLDTWFSSALWPLSTLGWPNDTKDLQEFYPTSVLITGNDILFFWVARMILMGKYLTGKVPFKETFVHGLIYGKSYWREKDSLRIYVSTKEQKAFDKGAPLPKDVQGKWEKMSKSKGNVIDPIDIIEDYGTDAMRFALASSLNHLGQIDLDQRRFEDSRNFINKIWNSARFVFFSTEDLQFSSGIDWSLCTFEDHWILQEVDQLIEKNHQHLHNYSYEKAASLLQDFYWKTFCSIYLESTKPYLKDASNPSLKENKQKLLTILLFALVRLFHPFIPFVTEELFSHIQERFSKMEPKNEPYALEFQEALKKKACIITNYPKVMNSPKIDRKSAQKMPLIQEILYTVRNIRGDMQIPPGEKITLYIQAKDSFTLTSEEKIFLHALVKIDTIHHNIPPTKTFGSSVSLDFVDLFVPLPEHLKAQEIKRLKKAEEKALHLIKSIEQKLSNPNFKAKAPKKLVEENEQNLEACSISIKELQKKINELS